MGSVGSQKETEVVVSQVCFGGFDEGVSARELTDFLQQQVGLIWRCRVKTSWTPPDSYPDFFFSSSDDVDDASSSSSSSAAAAFSSSSPTIAPTTASVRDKDDYPKVVPHAFVHFASPDAAKRAMNAAGRCDLVLGGRPCAPTAPPRAPSASAAAAPPTPSSSPTSASTSALSSPVTTSAPAGPAPPAPEPPISSSTPSTGCARSSLPGRPPSPSRAPATRRRSAAISRSNSWRGTSPRSGCTRTSVARDAPAANLRALHILPDRRRRHLYLRALQPARRRGPVDPHHRLQSYRCRRPRQLVQDLTLPSFRGVGFPILFLVNALVHKGIVNQHQLSDQFFGLLRGQNGVVNETALRHIWSYKRPIFDAYRRLKLVQEWLLNNPKLLRSSKLADYYAEVRRLVITPTKAYCIPPAIELSNRVLRRYKEVADRFLRVTFTDEGMQQLNNSVLNYYVAPIVKEITSNSYQQKTTVFKRVKSILEDGFYLCGRKYSFLAFSSNQLRDRSAWFFAEDSKTTVAAITKWMGRFSDRNVAKCAARIGQCFSSTYATVEVPLREVNPVLPDIEGNRYIFSDGIGKITPDLAMEVAEKLKLTDNPPLHTR
uniref:RNA-dependent RNA polymerase n=1 Tax=Ananas comosus var. bracteatus TaxID=296719 RepID=A0A6V7PSJ5_ANACO|nr:unnamed protein product [Ananas comosus var. bracteatus]